MSLSKQVDLEHEDVLYCPEWPFPFSNNDMINRADALDGITVPLYFRAHSGTALNRLVFPHLLTDSLSELAVGP
jgi:hypothetical protein